MSDATRLDALLFLQHWYGDHPTDRPREIGSVLETAMTVTEYLGVSTGGGVVLKLRVGPVIDSRTGAPVARTLKGTTMQLHDNEQVTYTLSAVDAKGVAITGDTFSCTSDNTTAVTVTENADGSFVAVAGTPGSATLTFTDGTLSVTEAIDVIAGDAVAISVTAGTVEKQPTA